MAPDTFTETTTTSWFSRIGDSIKGILVGIIMVTAAFPVLFMNEGCAVKTRKMLDQGSKECVHVEVNAAAPANDGKLVHLVGDAVSDQQLQDPLYHVQAKALKLRRQVEMYQWKEETSKETKKKLGGSEETVTTYTYSKVWQQGAIESSKFKQSAEHTNPSTAIKSETWTAKSITVGAFTLNGELTGQISNFTPILVEANTTNTSSTENTPTKPGATAEKSSEPKLVNGQYYQGANPDTPQIGDLRISFQKVNSPTEVSIIAQQTGKTFEHFTGKSGATLQMLHVGNHSAAAMFEQAQNSNKIRTWVVRAVGFILMFIGFSMLFKPLSVIADILPIAGTIVGVGTGLVSFLLATPLTLCTIAMAWIFYRPMIGIPLLIAAAVGIFFLIKKLIAYKKSQG